MCELFLVGKDAQKVEVMKTAVGFAILPVSKATDALQVYKGSARNLMLDKPDSFETVPGVKVLFALSKESGKFKGLEKLLRTNCLVNENDPVPGLASALQVADFDSKTAFSPTKTVYTHDVQLSNLPLIESTFNQYLKLLCMQHGANPQQPV